MVQLDTEIIESTAVDANVVSSMFQNAGPGFFIFIFMIAIAIIIVAFFTIVGSILKKYSSGR